MRNFVPLTLIFLGLSSTAALANDFIETHGDWSVFANKPNKATSCHMGSEPTKETGKYKKRGDAYVLVAHDRQEKTYNVVSFAQGYGLKKDSDVVVTIGKKSFKLFVDGETAWARDSATDKALVVAMRGGAEMIVSGISGRGTKTTDTYSLKGITAAHKAINKICGVK
ncbi:MAG: invasion associated locus B family protein [Rhodospirillales bacterium]|nr:invasion associated locus B family protein [Rhodospirillales bacterium]